MQTYIRTKSGRHFEYLNPKADSIDITDIAHALSQLCRFSGQSPVFYSVAQHSVYTSQLCELAFPGKTELALAALLHDATEAYMNDVPLPLKNILPEYTKLEDKICKLIYKRFGIPQMKYSDVKLYDRQALYGEFVDIIKICPPFEIMSFHPEIMPGLAWSSAEAEVKFLSKFISLTEELNVNKTKTDK